MAVVEDACQAHLARYKGRSVGNFGTFAAFSYVIQAENRGGLQKHLADKGIATGLHYPLPLHLQPAYKDLGYKQGDFPVAEAGAQRILSLPMYPELRPEQIDHVCQAIRAFQEAS